MPRLSARLLLPLALLSAVLAGCGGMGTTRQAPPASATVAESPVAAGAPPVRVQATNRTRQAPNVIGASRDAWRRKSSN